MSVLFDFRRDESLSRFLLLALVTIGLVGLLSTAALQGQEDLVAVEGGVEGAAESSELWSRVVERYEVVVLSRGLLLEPLGDEVELRTIEVSDEGVAIDGQQLELDQVTDRLGADDAALVLALVDMDQESRMALFEDAPASAIAVELEESEGQDEDTEDREAPHKTETTQVIVGQSHVVEADEISHDAFVFGGPLTIYGKVIGDATAIGGSVTVEGEVTGDVVAIGGSVKLKEGAEVLGDAVSIGARVERAEGARVMGQVVEVPFVPNLSFGGPGLIFFGRDGDADENDLDKLTPLHIVGTFIWAGFRLVVVALLAFLVMLVARQPLERVRGRAASEPWRSGLVGLVSQILIVPLLIMVVLILAISIIGIPLLLLVPFACLALVLVAFLGFCAVCWNIGQFLANRLGWQLSSPYIELLVGVVMVRILTIVGHLLDVGWGPLWFFGAMLCLAGAMIQYAVWTIGLGAAVLTRFGSAERWKSGDAPPPVESSPVIETEGQIAEAIEPVSDVSAADFDLRTDEGDDEPQRD